MPKITLSFDHDDGQDNPGDQVQFDAPANWNAMFGPPIIKATIGGRERLFYRVEYGHYYHEAVPTDVGQIIAAVL